MFLGCQWITTAWHGAAGPTAFLHVFLGLRSWDLWDLTWKMSAMLPSEPGICVALQLNFICMPICSMYSISTFGTFMGQMLVDKISYAIHGAYGMGKMISTESEVLPPVGQSDLHRRHFPRLIRQLTSVMELGGDQLWKKISHLAVCQKVLRCVVFDLMMFDDWITVDMILEYCTLAWSLH